MPILWGNIDHPIVGDESSSQVEQTLYSLRKMYIHTSTGGMEMYANLVGKYRPPNRQR